MRSEGGSGGAPPQRGVVAVLDARLADLVARLDALVAGLLELGRGDLSGVPENLGGEAAVRVVTHVHLLDAHPGVRQLVLT